MAVQAVALGLNPTFAAVAAVREHHGTISTAAMMRSNAALQTDCCDAAHMTRNGTTPCCFFLWRRAAQGGGLVATMMVEKQPNVSFELRIGGSSLISKNYGVLGGGLAVVSSTTWVGPGVRIVDNQAVQGGGIAAISGCAECTATLILDTGAEVSGNNARVAGGGIYMESSRIMLDEDIARRITTGNTAPFGPQLLAAGRCMPGEINVGEWCAPCGRGLYSFNPTNTSCDVCPEGAVCTGSAEISPLPGHWHSSPWSTQVHACPNPAACTPDTAAPAHLHHGGSSSGKAVATGRALLAAAPPQASVAEAAGGVASQQPVSLGASESPVMVAGLKAVAAAAAPDSITMDWQCSAGYRGRLCGTCASGYGSHGPFQCLPCLSRSSAVARLAAAGGTLVVLVDVVSRLTWHDNRDGRPLDALRPSDVAKLLVVYGQFSAVLSALPAAWPRPLEATLEAATWLFSAGASQLVSVDCALLPRSSNGPQPSLARALAHLVAPAAVLVITLALQAVVDVIVALVLMRRRRRRRHASLRRTHAASAAAAQPGTAGANQGSTGGGMLSPWRDRAPVTFLVTLTVFYPTLVRLGPSFFACYRVDNVGGDTPYASFSVCNEIAGYWTADMDVPCWKGWHARWALAFGLPAALVFCVLVPVALAALALRYGRSRWGATSTADDSSISDPTAAAASAQGDVTHDDADGSVNHNGNHGSGDSAIATDSKSDSDGEAPGTASTLLQHGGRFEAHWGSLVRPYRSSARAWEAVIALELVTLVIASVFGPNLGLWQQASLLAFLLSTALLALAAVRPYRSLALQLLALGGVATPAMTGFAALTFVAAGVNDGPRPGQAYLSALGGLVLAANVAFLAAAAAALCWLGARALRRLWGRRHSAMRGGSAGNKGRRGPGGGPLESKGGLPKDAVPRGARRQLVSKPVAVRDTISSDSVRALAAASAAITAKAAAAATMGSATFIAVDNDNDNDAAQEKDGTFSKVSAVRPSAVTTTAVLEDSAFVQSNAPAHALARSSEAAGIP
jgi:hypothetical protein